MCASARSHLRCVSVKYTGIMSFSVCCKVLYHLRIDFVSIVLARLDRHTDTAVRLESTFERLVRLETDNLLFLFI